MGTNATTDVRLIEFNGLPGCGKTTTALILEKKLRENGIKVGKRFKFSEGINYSIEKFSQFKELFLLAQIWFCITPRTKMRQRYIKLTLQLLQYIKFLKKKDTERFYLLDQGVIQSFLSISYAGRLNHKKCYEHAIRNIIQGIDHVIFINCKLSTDKTYSRILERKTKFSRLDFLKGDQLKNALDKHNIELKIIRKYIPEYCAIDIDMNCTPEKNVDIIFKRLKEMQII